MKIIGLRSSSDLAAKVAKQLHSELVMPEERRFPDGELYVRCDSDLSGEDVFIIGNTHTDAEIIEMILTLSAVRDYAVKSVNIIAPYYGYARQHQRYRRGEPISSQILTEIFASYSRSIATVDIHDEQTLSYSKVKFTDLHADRSIVDFYRHVDIDYVVSPDDGGLDRVKHVAEALGKKYFYIEKKRIDDRTVEMKAPDIDLKGKNVLILDDIISTGGTIAKSSAILRQKGASRIYVSAIHGLFVNSSESKILENADEIHVTDTVAGKYSDISVYQVVCDYITGTHA
ncbi:ribose-phosphate diphosphokinase [Thermoplasma sp.]|uniref:ribose-phosphate diphosphokinase n=1 Tax=Thermoplasma sp. TaxID=1973142 RepID=UPI001281B55F|nr:ribose-phosphate diphosphokinase [Thermoplasma sp.]KAA8922306.1 MAG: ribose-phosphate diphosphokinase [Thermoplasma sp.]